MRSQDELLETAQSLLNTKNLKVLSLKPIQSLWAGYGHICRIQVVPTSVKNSKDTPCSLILKFVTPPADQKKQEDEGHLRKMISYQVEQYFYSYLAASLPSNVAVAQCLASINEQKASGNTVAMILTDLTGEFPVAGEKRGELSEMQVYATLAWLAGFHGFWWSHKEQIERQNLKRPPLEESKRLQRSVGGVWLNGGYTYLATRQKEYTYLKDETDSEWSKRLCKHGPSSQWTIAELVARALSTQESAGSTSPIVQYETLIHGDVKSENLFTTSTSNCKVAFFDFQYVGLGLGVCDLAKLFTCSVPLELLSTEHGSRIGMHPREVKLLEYYQETIQVTSGKEYPWDILVMHWNTALVDWLRFQASWGFWGNTEWLEARVRYILDDKSWTAWLLDAAEHTTSP